MAIFTKDKSFYKNLIMLAVPISLQQLITFSVGFADNLMVGTLGDTAVSSVYMGNQIQTMLQLTLGGVAGAMGILSSQYWGKKQTDTIKTIVAIGMRFALMFGLILTLLATIFPQQLLSLFTNEQDVIKGGAEYLFILAFSYVFFCISQIIVAIMRSVESPRVGLLLSIITLCVNVSLNWVFIFGKLGLPAMGVKGAALATLLSRIVEALFMLWYLFYYDKKLQFKMRDFLRRNTLLLKDFIKYGIPVIGGDMVWSINMLAQSAILGRLAKEAITAVSVASMFHNLAYIWVTGLWSSVAIITGKTVGAGLYDKMKEYAKTTQVLFLIIGVFTGALLFVLRDPFVSLYSISATATSIADELMLVLCVTIIGSTYQATCLGGLVKAGGDISFVLKNDTIFVFLVVLPAGIIALNLGAPAWVVFACLKLDQIFKCFVAVVKINSFNWMKNLTRN